MTSSNPTNPTTNVPSNDPLDARFDASLRAAAQGVGGSQLPADPTPERVARWRGEAAFPMHGAGRRARSEAAHGRRRWFAGLSAAAAMVAIGAVAIVTLPLSRPVQASTILSSLRAATVSGVKVSLIDLQSKGVLVNGEMRIHFPEAFAMERILDEDAERTLPEPSEAYMNVDIQMDENGPAPGLHARAEGAFTAGSSWFFAQSSEIPVERLQGVPPIAIMIAGLLKNGLMIDMGEGLPEKLHEHHAEHAKKHDRALQVGAGPQGDMQVKIRDHFADRAAKAKARRDAARQAGDGEARPEAKRADEGEGIAQFIPQLRALLSGQAGASELEGIRQMLQQEAAGAAVEPLGEGRYILSAAGPDPSGRHALMRVSYVQGSGVEWIEFSRIEGATGTVRIELLNSPIDPAKLDKTRLIEPGRTMQITHEMIQQWLPMLVPGSQPGEQSEDAE